MDKTSPLIPNQGQIIGLKFEHTDPAKDPKLLARQLGEAISNEEHAKKNAEVFAKEAADRERKANELDELLVRIHARDAGQPVKTTSRMDPMLTYSASDVEGEIRQLRGQAGNFRGDVRRYVKEAENHHKEFVRVQRALQSQ